MPADTKIKTIELTKAEKKLIVHYILKSASKSLAYDIKLKGVLKTVHSWDDCKKLGLHVHKTSRKLFYGEYEFVSGINEGWDNKLATSYHWRRYSVKPLEKQTAIYTFITSLLDKMNKDK